MSFEKAIQHGKEKRKQHKDSKRFDYSCRNHGSCSYCENTRTHTFKLHEFAAIEEIKEWENQIE